MKTELLNESEPIEINLMWMIDYPAEGDPYDFPEIQSFGGQGGDEPDYREY